MRGLVCGIIMMLGAAAKAEPPPLEVFAALPMVQDVALSPDGRRMAALMNTPDGKRIVQVVEFGDGGAPSPIGALDASRLNTWAVDWANDNYVLLWASSNERNYYFVESNIEFHTVFSWNMNDDPAQLLARGRELAVNSSVSTIISTVPGEDKVLMTAYAVSSTGDAIADREYSVFEVDLRRGRGELKLRGYESYTRAFMADREGRVRARIDHASTLDSWRIHAIEGLNDPVVYNVSDSPRIPFSVMGLTPDSDSLLISGYPGADGAEIRYLSLADGTISEPVYSRAGADIRGAIGNVRSDERLGFSVSSIDGPDYVFFDPTLQTMMDEVKAMMPASSIRPVSWSDDRQVWLFHAQGGTTAGAYLRYDRATGAANIIAEQHPGIASDRVASVQSIEYRARDGLTITGLLTLPIGATPSNLPTILLPHGGPELHDYYGWDWMAQYFANQGYAVLQPNFRGSDGFGEAFTHAGYGEWGRAMQDDLTDGVNAMVAAGYTDPDRVCIVGWSYGGYAALAGAVFTPELYRCVIAGAGVSDLNRMLRDEIRMAGRDSWVVDYWREVMQGPDADTRLRDVSPVHFADNVQAPVLLIHGKDDIVVEIDQSLVMRSALNRADKQVEFVELRGEDHDLMTPETRIEALRAMDTFLKTHLGPGAGGG